MIGRVARPSYFSFRTHSLHNHIWNGRNIPLIPSIRPNVPKYNIPNQRFGLAIALNEQRAKNVDTSRELNDLLQRRKYPEAEEIYKKARSEGLRPNVLVYTSMIKIYGRQGKLDDLFQILQEMKANQTKSDEDTFNSLIDLYSRRGELDDMLKLYEWMKNEGIRRNKKTYNFMIEGFSKKGDTMEMDRLFRKMREDRIKPDANTYTYMIDAFGKCGDTTKMGEFFTQMKKEGIQPSIWTFQSLTSGYAMQGDLKNVDDIVRQLRDLHFLQPDATIWGNIIEACWKNKQFKRVFDIFNDMAKQSALSYKVCRSLLYNLRDDEVPDTTIDLWRGMTQKFERRNGDAPLPPQDAKDFLWFLEELRAKLIPSGN